MKYSEYSVVIIGSGAAGLYSALKISQQIALPDGIILITKSKLGESNSMYAQGGIVGVIHQNKDDSVELHVKDTINAGAGLCDIDAVKDISEASDVVINDLISSDINFDEDDNGNLNFTLEAAHSVRRILHSGGDATGKNITTGLMKKVLEDETITIQENSIAVELLIDMDNNCKGVILYNELTGEHEIVYTSALVLATGGVGQVYKYTTNPECTTGDGIALAYNAGAIIQDMEFIQFHPTALALSSESKNRFLISEAVRGEGAKLINHDGKEFMASYHDKRELAPRDIVARAIFSEMKKDHASNVFLNASIIGCKKLLDRFPTISKKCRACGIDISQKPIPVAPAAHYTMGGIKSTIEGRTSIKGLYAIGEVASTGLHGANRLASNSLLECVVMAYELADYLSFANLSIPKKIQDVINNHPNNVYFPGYVKGPIIEGAYLDASCFFFPSNEETEGIVVLEALASKQNVLVRDIGVFDPWLVDKRDCYKGKTVDEFVSLIDDIANHRLPSTKENGYKVAMEKDIAKIGEQLKKVYETVLNME